MRTLLAIAGALLAAALIVALALSGRAPSQEALVRFEPAGILGKSPSHADRIDLQLDERTFVLTRAASGRWANANRPGAPGLEALNRRIVAALHLLEVTAPSREFGKARYSKDALAQFGFVPQHFRLTLFVNGAPAGSIEFGSLNPSKTTQYVRVTGREELYLMPLHLGRQWEAVAQAAAQQAEPFSPTSNPRAQEKPVALGGANSAASH